MPSSDPPARKYPPSSISSAAGVALFLAIQYAASLWRLAGSTHGMENKFSALARDQYMGFLVRENLHALLAYVVLWIGACLLVIPLAALARKKRPLVIIPLSFLLTALIHGWFVLRLVKTRPYFLNEAEFGQWYYKSLDVIPEAAKPAAFTLIFTLLPAAVVLWAASWHFRHRPRLTTVCLLAVTALFFLPPLFRKNTASAPPRTAVAGDQPPNILILGSDSLRADRLGCAGYRPWRSDGAAAAGVSPHIDSLAARSARFSRFHTSIASTMESGVQLMTSTYPHSHGLRVMYPDRATVDAMEKKTTPLARVLREKGYDTAAIGDWCAGYYQVTPLEFADISVSTFDNFKIYMSQAVVMAHFVIPLYFDNALGYRLFPQIESFAQFVTPEIVTRRVEDRLAASARSGKPFFWHVFYSCNHLPYRSAEPYVSMFADPSYRGENKNGVNFDIDRFIGGTDLSSKWKALPDKEVRQLRALYDGCTRQFDTCVGRILSSLEKNDLAGNTIVIITGDHGDDLYEPNVTLGHGLTFNGAASSYHPPLILHVPGGKPRVFPETTRMIDVAPTLADFAGAPIPAAWEGKTLAPWIRNAEAPTDRPVYAETGFPFIQFDVPGVTRPKLPAMDELTFIDPAYHYQFVLKPEYLARLIAAKQRCLMTRDWKIVCTPTAAGGRHFALYHTASDHDCTRDLAPTRPEVLAPLQAALERWIDHHKETEIPAIFPAGEPQ